MVANVQAFVDPAGKLRELPNLIGRRWQAREPFQTMCRRGPVWHFRDIDMGTVLEFAGWAGLQRSEPFAGFTSPDLPGWTVYLPPGKLAKWCRELEPEVVKVRIADECESGEGE